MKNRLFAFMTVFVVAFGLAACDRGTTTTTTPTTTPTTTAPAVTDPVATDPVATDPVATDPVVTDPVATDPVVTDPVATDPVATDPVATDPVATDPVATTPETDVTTVEGDVDAVAGADMDGAITAELEQAHQEAAQELQTVDFQAQTDEAVQDAQVAVATARQNLETAYQEAGEATSAQWQDLQAEFDRVEQALSDGATNALQEVEALLNRIQNGLN